MTDHVHGPNCGCHSHAAGPAVPVSFQEALLAEAVAAAQRGDWSRTATLLEPVTGPLLAGTLATPAPSTARERVLAVRLAAAAQEQLGDHRIAGDIWEVFFRSVAPGSANLAAMLADMINLVRVRAKVGALDEGLRRRFTGRLADAVRDGDIPRPNFLKLAAIFRAHMGCSFLAKGEPEAAFDAFGRALWLIRRHHALFVNERGDVDGIFADLEKSAALTQQTAWRGRPIDLLSSAAWEKAS